ncbi:MAG TPA: preprotein translocase subunit SecY [Polyangiaceae bacterium]|jgi:preprotein translocase subunit SecY|nr:preprotein translocase subunit SecY [Polyangiaceae bacterium]
MAIFKGFSNIPRIPELRNRVLFSLMILVVYRFGVFVTIPGVDRAVMQALVGQQGGGLVSMLNLFSGGALSNLSIFALGIMPYISASIIMQLMGLVSKQVEELRREGEQGRRRIEQWTRYGCIVLSLVQSFWIARMLEGQNADVGGGQFGDVVAHPGWGFRLLTMLTLTTGTALIMWMGEQATDRGIGNGTSLIIFASIVSGAPGAISRYLAANAGQVQPLTIMVFSAVFMVAIAMVVFFERAQRRIPIQYARRQVGRRVYGGQSAHLPLKVNMASMIPAIFASSLLMFPATLAQMNIPGMGFLSSVLNRGDWVFNIFFASLIVFFCFFYTAVTFQPVDVADNLRRQQANIPGIRPGRQTAEYIDRVVSRVTVGGALYVAVICVVPSIVATAFRIPFQFGGSSLMIVVGVVLETANQIEAHLITQSYEGLTGPRATRLTARRPA